MSVYVLADLHGNGELYSQIKTFLQPSDLVYFLGDAIDRGDSGWEILKDMLRDERFLCILGNHEDMMLKVAQGEPSYEDFSTWMYNGGASTWKAINEDSPRVVEDIIEKVRALPLVRHYYRTDYIDVFMSHSGWGIHNDDKDIGASRDKYLWNRSHYLSNDDDLAGKLVVHGHTPVQLLPDIGDHHIGSYIYNNGKKVDIDCGTAFSKHTVLLDLDTLDEFIF